MPRVLQDVLLALFMVGMVACVIGGLVWLFVLREPSKPKEVPLPALPLPLPDAQAPASVVVDDPPALAGHLPSVELTFCELASLMTWDGWYRYRGPDDIVYLRVTPITTDGTEFAVERVSSEVLAKAAGAGDPTRVAIEVFAIVNGQPVTMETTTVDARLPRDAPPLVDSALDAYKPVGPRLDPAQQRALRLQLINAVPMRM